VAPPQLPRDRALNTTGSRDLAKKYIALLALMACAPLPTDAPDQTANVAAQSTPNWIWLGPATDDQEVVFQKTFEVSATPASAVLSGSCDNHMVVSVNGERVGSHDSWEEVVSLDVSDALLSGKNTIEVRARNDGGVAGLALRLAFADGRTIVTDESWQAALPNPAMKGWWSDVTVLGPVGSEDLVWSNNVSIASYDENAGTMRADKGGGPQAPQVAEGLTLPDGFEADLLYTVPNGMQGSWVSLAKDDQGRLYTSDQGKRGIYRVTPAEIGNPDAVTSVEKVPVEVSGAQGMCWAFDSLYVNVNGEGLYRITDTDDDDQLDRAEHLIKLGHGGEHGPHAILPTQDGKGLYFMGGNHIVPPEFDGSRAPDNWDEDLLLPRQWDANGHARGKLAPGGWIARCDPNGQDIEIVSNGFRNQYDIALNQQGEMFTYDSDMEWDIGSPWYRPTRVCHVTSGSEFGWRAGTGKWPRYYEDSLPPVLEIGPGCPTGIVFGAGAKFPAKYQEALFLLDWTFGTIYMLQLEPDGASYSATKEDFAWAKPLGVTDAVIGADGSLYFTVGGRGSQSALYRIRYSGSESTAPVTPAVTDAGSEARGQRRALEAFHGKVDAGAVEAAWPSLSSADRFIRFAARIAVENQPVETWRARALGEENPQAAVMVLIALARQGVADDLPDLVAALGRLDLPALEEQQRLAALRAYALAFTRLGEPDDALREHVIAALDPLFPAASAAVNTELARLLTYLGSSTVVAKTLSLMSSGDPDELPEWAELIKRNDTYGGPIAKMLANMPPIQNIAYALILRNATEGWTMPMRREYFTFFVEASEHPGGASYAGFLENIREEAEETLTVAEQHSLASLLGQTLVAALPEDITPIAGPGRQWTRDGATEVVGQELSGRSFSEGRNLFHAASCSTCHRFDGEGGAIGPDLTTVANKFSVSDIFEAIVEPSKVISDQYGSHIVFDNEGRSAEGILVEDGDEVTVYARDRTALATTFGRAEIESIEESQLSQMPSGLIDGMNPEELRDLLAYLISGGDKKSEVFQASAAGEDAR
jgi:putative heme-binding domain-containing protein